jgi:hypothetical protein
LGLHSEDNLSSLYEKICQQIETLRTVDLEFKTEKYLATLITFFNQGTMAIEKLQTEATRNLEVNTFFNSEKLKL